MNKEIKADRDYAVFSMRFAIFGMLSLMLWLIICGIAEKDHSLFLIKAFVGMFIVSAVLVSIISSIMEKNRNPLITGISAVFGLEFVIVFLWLANELLIINIIIAILAALITIAIIHHASIYIAIEPKTMISPKQ